MSFDELYETYYEQIFRYSCRLMGDVERAEDITQDTFARLIDALNAQKTIENPRAWLYTVATNLGRNLLRRRTQYEQILDETKDELQGDNNPEQVSIQNEQKQQVLNVLAELPVRDQVLIQLYRQGLSYREIALITGIRQTSVGKMLSRAIEKCADKIQKVT
jgi:RNA polymerase sigma factor (sigma-70 family)